MKTYDPYNSASDKSYVGLEHHRCLVCTVEYPTPAVLLDKRMRNSLPRNPVTGWGLCPDHQSKYDEGYIALIGCDPALTKTAAAQHGEPMPVVTRQEDAYRTGEVVHLQLGYFEHLFGGVPTHPNGQPLPMVFVEQEVIDKLRSMTSSVKSAKSVKREGEHEEAESGDET